MSEPKRLENIKTNEQETTITMYRADDKWELYTSDTTIITKLMKVTEEQDREVLSIDDKGKPSAMIFYLDKKQVSFRNKPKESSEATKAARSNNMKKVRGGKQC